MLLISADQWSSQDGSIIVQALHKWRASDGTCQESWESGEGQQRKGSRGGEHTGRLSAIAIWVHLGVALDELNGKKDSKMGHWKKWQQDQAREEKGSTGKEQIWYTVCAGRKEGTGTGVVQLQAANSNSTWMSLLWLLCSCFHCRQPLPLPSPPHSQFIEGTGFEGTTWVPAPHCTPASWAGCWAQAASGQRWPSTATLAAFHFACKSYIQLTLFPCRLLQCS